MCHFPLPPFVCFPALLLCTPVSHKLITSCILKPVFSLHPLFVCLVGVFPRPVYRSCFFLSTCGLYFVLRFWLLDYSCFPFVLSPITETILDESDRKCVRGKWLCFGENQILSTFSEHSRPMIRLRAAEQSSWGSWVLIRTGLLGGVRLPAPAWVGVWRDDQEQITITLHFPAWKSNVRHHTERLILDLFFFF